MYIKWLNFRKENNFLTRKSLREVHRKFLLTQCFFFYSRRKCHTVWTISAVLIKAKNINAVHATRCMHAYCACPPTPAIFSIYFSASLLTGYFLQTVHRHLYRHCYMGSTYLLVATTPRWLTLSTTMALQRVAQFMRIHFTGTSDSAVFLVIPYSLRSHAPRDRQM